MDSAGDYSYILPTRAPRGTIDTSWRHASWLGATVTKRNVAITAAWTVLLTDLDRDDQKIFRLQETLRWIDPPLAFLALHTLSNLDVCCTPMMIPQRQ